MKKFLWLLFFYPYLVFGQINALYSLLNWNTPEQQKGLIAWYDLQDPSAVQLGANQQIFMLKDKSIWNNHISQLTSSYQPLFISDSKLNTSATVNGISFANGGYMTFRFPSTKTVQGITSFVICKNSLGGSKLLYDLSLEGGEGVASCYAGLDKVESRVPNSLVAFEPNFSTNPNQYLFIATRGSAGNVQASLNDSQYVGQGTRNFVGDRYNRIRLSTEQGVAPSDGTLYELVLFDRKLTDDEFNSVKKYLEEKYQVNYKLTNSTEVASPSKSSLTQSSRNIYEKINEVGLKKVFALVSHKITLEDIVSKRFDGYTSKEYVGRFINTEKWGLVNSTTSQEIAPVIYDHIDNEFVNGFIFTKSEYKYFLIRKTGEVTQLKNYKFIDIGSEEGCCYIYDKELRKFKDINNKIGFLSPNWEIAIPAIYDDVSGNVFRNGLVVLKLNGKLGILNNKSEFFQLSSTISKVENFNINGFATYSNSINKKGVINQKGQIIVPALYDYIDLSVSSIHFGILLNKKEGIIDRSGKIIIPPNYYRILLEYNSVTKENYYKVISITKKEGIFDLNGNQVVPPIHDAISAQNGKILVRVKGEWVGIDDLNSNSNASKSKSSLIEGNSKNTQQKPLSDQIADKIIQEGYNDFLKGLNNPNPTKNTSNGVRHRCTWCNKGFSSTGWILEKTRVIRSGSPYAEPVISSNERCKAHYDTQECALRARKARDGY